MKKLIIAVLFMASSAIADLVKPKDYKDFEKTTVMITNKEGNSGGTGWILKSTPIRSYIVTNKHVCGIAETFGSMNVITKKGTIVLIQ